VKLLFTTFLFFINYSFFVAQTNDTVVVNYYIHPPFCIKDSSQNKGLEIDIINEYILWLKITKKQNVIIKYKPFTEFNSFYATTKTASKNTIGLGAVTITPDKLKEIEFTTGYLKNVAFCITNGNSPDIKAKIPAEIVKTLGSMTALTVTNSALSKHVADLKKTYIVDLKIKYELLQTTILDEIAKNVLYFGFVDALEFWFYLKANPSRFLKMQKILNQSKEEFGFILPKGSSQKALFNEFFTTFKASRNYRAILEKYMGSYMTQNMAVN